MSFSLRTDQIVWDSEKVFDENSKSQSDGHRASTDERFFSRKNMVPGGWGLLIVNILVAERVAMDSNRCNPASESAICKG